MLNTEELRSSLEETKKELEVLRIQMKKTELEVDNKSKDHRVLKKEVNKAMQNWTAEDCNFIIGKVCPEFLRELPLEVANVGHAVFSQAQDLIAKQEREGGCTSIRWPACIIELFARIYSRSSGDYNFLQSPGFCRMPSGRLMRAYLANGSRCTGVDVGRILEQVKDLKNLLRTRNSVYQFEDVSSVCFGMDEMSIARDYVICRSGSVFGLPVKFKVLGLHDKLGTHRKADV
tara:strand:+ start:193 stop:888 length:696 start_codon:yes stop_codon:yes gene_type:complete